MEKQKNKYYNLKKEELAIELEKALKIVEKYETIQRKYDILKKARKEEEETINKAKTILSNFKQREDNMAKSFNSQVGVLQNNISEQNKTILTLFEMVDRSINEQIFFYQKFKEIFMGSPERVNSENKKSENR